MKYRNILSNLSRIGILFILYFPLSYLYAHETPADLANLNGPQVEQDGLIVLARTCNSC